MFFVVTNVASKDEGGGEVWSVESLLIVIMVATLSQSGFDPVRECT